MSQIPYPNLAADFGWRPGVYRAPVGYQHPWVAVSATETSGHWTRAEARRALGLVRPRRWYAIAYTYGVACDEDGELIGAVVAFDSRAERDAWVAEGTEPYRTRPGYREAVLARSLTRRQKEVVHGTD